MGDHGIVSSYRPDATGTIQPVLLSPRNDPAQAWGLALYRSTLYAFITALDPESDLPGDDMRLLADHLSRPTLDLLATVARIPWKPCRMLVSA